MAVRLALLTQHYRSDWEWSPALLDAGRERLAAWRAAVAAARRLRRPRTCWRSYAPASPTTSMRLAPLAAVDAWAADSSSAVAGAGELVRDLVDALLGVALYLLSAHRPASLRCPQAARGAFPGGGRWL